MATRLLSRPTPGARSMSARPASRRSPVPVPRLRPAPASTAELHADLLARIRERTATVGIIGLGYVGLPLARAFTDRGFPVLGFDTDPEKVARLGRGESYIKHISADSIQTMLGRRFAATAEFERLCE